MKYIVKLCIEGQFPGNSEHDYYPVDKFTYDAINNILSGFKRFDTLEDARKHPVKG